MFNEALWTDGLVKSLSWEPEWRLEWFAMTSLTRRCRVVHVPSGQSLDIVSMSEQEFLIRSHVPGGWTLLHNLEDRRIEAAKERIWSRWMAL